MESIFSVVIILMALLLYLANRTNPINRWCAVYVSFASIGAIKEAFLYQAIPFIQATWGDVMREDIYIGVYSVLTWLTYSTSGPFMFIMGLYFYGLHHSKPKLLTLFKTVIWIPMLILTFIYCPLHFRSFQLEGKTLWYIYCILYLLMGAAVVTLMVKGILNENTREIKRQKAILGACILPPTVYVIFTTYVIHALGLERWFKVWQWNVILIALCLVTYVVMAFRGGFIGLKLTAQVYRWDSELELARKSVNYTNHMLKNQIAKMELSIEQLKSHYENGGQPEEIAILTRSIALIKNYIDRIRRHSQQIELIQEPCRVSALLAEAVTVLPISEPNIEINIDMDDTIYIICDRSHMIEVFLNIITNAAEAMNGNGTIHISEANEQSAYCLFFKDNGPGIDADLLVNIFEPYFTTKNMEKNFGLGLTYCKNVIEKHGGSIMVESSREKGTTITIAFPVKRVSQSGG